MSRSRKYVFTLNNYTEEEEAGIIAASYDYLCYGYEVGAGGTPHLQGFIYFHDARTTTAVIAAFGIPRIHFELGRGSISQAVDYCQKDGDYAEYGVRPMDQAEKGAAGAERIAEHWALARAGEFEQLPCENLQRYQYACEYAKPKPAALLRQDFHWVWGPSGCGKSRSVNLAHPGAYMKDTTKWWDGYQGQEVVIIEDMDPTVGKPLSRYLKIWADYQPFPAERKGGSTMIRPKTVIITSQYSIRTCFEDHETISAIERRYKVQHLAYEPLPEEEAPDA